MIAGGDTNLYRYVLNNPVNYTDPSGLRIPPLGGFIGGTIGGAIGGVITGNPIGTDADRVPVPSPLTPEQQRQLDNMPYSSIPLLNTNIPDPNEPQLSQGGVCR